MVRKSALLLVLMISGVFSCRAQIDTSVYRFSLGFNLSANHSLLGLQLLNPLPAGAGLRVQNEPGLDLGVFAQMDMGESIRIRPQLALTFLNNALIYTSPDGEDETFEVSGTFLEIPLHFHFTHQTLTQNISVIFGLRHSRNLESVLGTDPSMRDRFNSFELGLGKDFDLGSFHMAPEILLSLGIEDLYRFSSAPELSSSIDGLWLNRLSFRLVFFAKGN